MRDVLGLRVRHDRASVRSRRPRRARHRRRLRPRPRDRARASPTPARAWRSTAATARSSTPRPPRWPNAGINVRVLPFDVTDEAAVAAGVAEIERDLGPVDILVNNAAVNQRQALEEFSLERMARAAGRQSRRPVSGDARGAAGMKSRRRGKIINICSLASDLGRPNIVAYATSKGALKMLTRALAVELAPFNVQVNGIAPGILQDRDECAADRQRRVLGVGRQAHARGALGRAAGDRRRRRVPRVGAPPTTSPATCCTSTAASPLRTKACSHYFRASHRPRRGAVSTTRTLRRVFKAWR